MVNSFCFQILQVKSHIRQIDNSYGWKQTAYSIIEYFNLICSFNVASSSRHVFKISQSNSSTSVVCIHRYYISWDVSFFYKSEMHANGQLYFMILVINGIEFKLIPTPLWVSKSTRFPVHNTNQDFFLYLRLI